MHTLGQVEDAFPTLEQVYFFTIKPPRDLAEFAFVNKSEVLSNYFEKKDYISFHVNCRSKKGYNHYHGIIKLNTLDREKRLKALQRYVNRNFGYLKIDPIKFSVKSAYEYITNYEGNNPSKSYLNNI